MAIPMSPDSNLQEGGCLCGAVRFRVDAAPLALSRCHCRSCRLATGAPGVAWAIFDRDHLVWLRGEPQLARFRSSPGVMRPFCGGFGSAIGYAPDAAPGQIELTTATFDHPNLFPPSREIWTEHRVSWVPLDAALAHHAQGSSSGSSA